MRLVVGVRRWVLVVGGACVVGAFLGSAVGRYMSAPPSPPKPPGPCKDEISVRDTDVNWDGVCDRADQRLTIERLDLPRNHMLIRCACAAPDGGTP